jgi:thiamine biosynthesis protein ThiS
MTLQINGESRSFPDGLTVATLIGHLGMKTDRVAVELNLEIVPRSNWDSTHLKDGDKLEIVHFVGGGSVEAEAPLATVLSWTCPSCGTGCSDKFCPVCGEKKAGRDDFSLRHFFYHLFEAFFHADSRIVRSFRVLFTEPGFLSAEYVRGRRKPYLHPLQMFFVANLAYFLLQPLTRWSGLRANLYVHMHMMSYSAFASRLVECRVAAQGVSLADFARAFDHVVDIQARSLVLLMVPVFALVLWVLEWRKRRFFGEHVVFALHFYSFWIVAVFLVIFGLSIPVIMFLAHRGMRFPESNINLVLGWVARAVLAVYLFVALRTFYRDKAPVAAFKAALLVTATLYIDNLYRFVLFLAALYSA